MIQILDVVHLNITYTISYHNEHLVHGIIIKEKTYSRACGHLTPRTPSSPCRLATCSSPHGFSLSPLQCRRWLLPMRPMWLLPDVH
jgi:hypothetical protein